MRRLCSILQVCCLLTLAGCKGGGKAAPLDGQGRMMLDPIRNQALVPEKLIPRLALPKNAVVADVGAGPGFLTLGLARAVPDGRVIATDISPSYLAYTADRVREERLSNVETRVVPPDHPGLGAATIDLALLSQVDHYLPDRIRYFTELKRALKPGGRIAIVNYVRYRDLDLKAATAADLRVVDDWAPSPPFFLLVFMPEPTPK
jgi:SAM-dependent methyltransferase